MLTEPPCHGNVQTCRDLCCRRALHAQHAARISCLGDITLAASIKRLECGRCWRPPVPCPLRRLTASKLQLHTPREAACSRLTIFVGLVFTTEWCQYDNTVGLLCTVLFLNWQKDSSSGVACFEWLLTVAMASTGHPTIAFPCTSSCKHSLNMYCKPTVCRPWVIRTSSATQSPSAWSLHQHASLLAYLLNGGRVAVDDI
jgi:hypothetical protein